MDIKTKFKAGGHLYTYRNGELEKFRVSKINIKVLSLPAEAISIEYELWTGREHISVPEELCFANLDEIYLDLQKRFEKLR
jgi:hypothetical protein